MEEIRRGLTLEYAKEKREKLLAELKSDEHYNQTETVAYGHHDPLSVPVAVCDSCHGRAQMQKVIGSPVRWNMVCLVCGKTVIPPFFGALKSRGHAACAKRCFGV
jgi:hypothetical protein